MAAVDGASGVLESDVLRKALTSYRDSGNVTHEAQLVAVNELGHEEVVNFSILTREQEQSLHEALGEFDSSHGIFRHVERASAFESAGMYDHVASEYDAALNEAPSSHDMLQAALNAHARIGNLRRARELRDKLQEIEALAETRK